MLILTRKAGESITVGDDIKITVLGIQGHQVRLGIVAPQKVAVHREEIYLKIQQENKKSTGDSKDSGERANSVSRSEDNLEDSTPTKSK